MAGLGRLEDSQVFEGLDLRYLKKSGVWEMINYYRENGVHGELAKMWRKYFIVSMFPVYVSCALSPFFSEPNIEDISNALLNPLSGFQTLVKTWVVWAYIDSLGVLLEIFKNDLEEFVSPSKVNGATKIMTAHAKKASTIINVCLCINVTVCLSGDIIPILRSEYVRETLGLEIFGKPRGYNKILGLWYPYMNETPYTQCYYIYELYTCGVCLFWMSLVEALAIHFVLLLTGRFKVLQYLLKEEESSTFPQSKATLLRYVKEHQKLLRIGDRLRIAFDYSMSMILASGTFILIIGVFNFFLGSGTGDKLTMIKFIVHISYTIAEVTIYCTTGSDLEDASSDVLFAAYGSEWYKKDMEFRKILLLIMTRSQNPTTIVAGRMYPVNHLVLTSILQMSYSTSMFLAKMSSEE